MQDSSSSLGKKEQAIQDFKSDPEAESDDVTRFDKSLKELKDLRSQLHYAADYCEMAFFKAKHKKMVIENTKEYICKAVVTVVDHLGSVSETIDCRVSSNAQISDTELRINCLKQRLQTCQEYAYKLPLTKVRWSENLPRYHPRYISQEISNCDKSNGVLRESDDSVASISTPKYKVDYEGEMLLYLYTYAPKPSVPSGFYKLFFNNSSASVLPVSDGPSQQSKATIPSFHFQANEQDRKGLQSNDFLSLLRRRSRPPINWRGSSLQESGQISPRLTTRAWEKQPRSVHGKAHLVLV